MDDATLQRKLNQLVKLANELDAEAKRRYGEQATLFYEAEGTFYIMAGDAPESFYRPGTMAARQEYIRHRSDGACRLGAGAW
jgi:hypothetical protein